MKCPFCEHPDTKVIDSRHTEDGHAIRRRRECEKCSRRFTTYEKIEEVVLMVIKKDGSRETFDRNKIMSGIVKACEKRPVSLKHNAEVSRLRTQLPQADRERHSLLDMLLQILRQNAMRLRQSPGRHGHGGLQPHEQQAR